MKHVERDLYSVNVGGKAGRLHGGLLGGAAWASRFSLPGGSCCCFPAGEFVSLLMVEQNRSAVRQRAPCAHQRASHPPQQHTVHPQAPHAPPPGKNTDTAHHQARTPTPSACVPAARLCRRPRCASLARPATDKRTGSDTHHRQEHEERPLVGRQPCSMLAGQGLAVDRCGHGASLHRHHVPPHRVALHLRVHTWIKV